MLKTTLCRQLGLDYPIFSVGMGTAAGPELTAAVSNSGACGVLGTARVPAWLLREQIQRVRALTNKPFGMNRILAHPQEGQIEVCFDEAVPFLVLFWGDPAPYVKDAHRRGIKVLIQVGSVEEAMSAAAAGVDAVIAQGVEAGGHVKSTISLSTLVPAVVEAVKPVPVIASGGIATGRGLAAALGLGAQAVSVGTRFLASDEAWVPREYKERVVKSTAEETIFGQIFDIGWAAPHRVLRNKQVAEWEAAGRPPSGQRPGEGEVIAKMPRAGDIVNVPRYSAFLATPGFEGDLDYAALYCGESCSLVKDIRPAAAIVREMVHEAEGVIAAMNAQ